MTKAKKVAKTTETKNSPVGNSGIPAPAKNGFNNRKVKLLTKAIENRTVSYTHLTLPTTDRV